MTIKIEREKAIEQAVPVARRVLSFCKHDETAVRYCATELTNWLRDLGLIEFVEPKSAEDAAREIIDKTSYGPAFDTMRALKSAGIGFTFTGEK